MGKALVLAFGAIIAAVLTRLLGDKARTWMRWLTKCLLRIAIERLPEAQRERFSEEWASHINEVPGEISKVAVALGCISAARQMASLSKPSLPSFGYSVTKRVLDIIGSLFALIFFLPVFVIIAVAIKSTSVGPVFFRQRRVGYHGEPFTYLKFRSMYVPSDAAVYKEYVRQLIAGKANAHPSNGNDEGVYKLTKDARITWVGAFLRKTSLDEFPQFINVLKGEMSLVGPRPPLPYEVDVYEDWHKLRFSAKPGITGLWQVRWRTIVKFDDMVKLDISYIQHASILLDLKILLGTPGAVVLEDIKGRFAEKQIQQANTVLHAEAQKTLRDILKDPDAVFNDWLRSRLRVGVHVKVRSTRRDGTPHPHASKTGRITKFANATALIKLDSGIEPQGLIWVSVRCLEALSEDTRS